MAAFDYMIDQPPALGSVLGGFEAGFALSERERQRQAQEAQMRAQQEAQMRAAQIQERFYNNQNPSLQDVIEFTTTLDPALVGHTKDMLAKLPEQQKQRNLSTGLQMLSALDTGSTDVVAQIAEESAMAMENSGDANTAQLLRRVAEVAKQDPNIARSGIMASLIQYPGGDEAIKSYIAVRKTPAEIAEAEAKARGEKIKADTELEKQKAEIANIYSQIQDRAARLGLDQDKLLSEIQAKQDELSGKKLTETSQKQVTEAQANAVMAEQASVSMNSLADRLEQLGGGYGRFANLAEWWANTTGNQDALSQARTDYVRIRNAAAIKALPPGVATDKDIELALKGFPPETADSQYLASFLRGAAKLQAAEAAFEDVKSQWIDSVGYLGKPRQDIEVGGVKVPAGTTIVQFWNKQGERFINQVQSRNALKKYDKYSGGASGSY